MKLRVLKDFRTVVNKKGAQKVFIAGSSVEVDSDLGERLSSLGVAIPIEREESYKINKKTMRGR